MAWQNKLGKEMLAQENERCWKEYLRCLEVAKNGFEENNYERVVQGLFRAKVFLHRCVQTKTR